MDNSTSTWGRWRWPQQMEDFPKEVLCIFAWEQNRQEYSQGGQLTKRPRSSAKATWMMEIISKLSNTCLHLWAVPQQPFLQHFFVGGNHRRQRTSNLRRHVRHCKHLNEYWVAWWHTQEISLNCKMPFFEMSIIVTRSMREVTANCCFATPAHPHQDEMHLNTENIILKPFYWKI